VKYSATIEVPMLYGGDLDKLIGCGAMDCFASWWGKDREVRAIVDMLVVRFEKQLTEAELRRYTEHERGADMMMRDLGQYCEFHGPHLFAGLCTEAGVYASIRGRQAAIGDYGVTP